MLELKEYTYKVLGQYIHLELDEENMGVRFNEPSSRSMRAVLPDRVDGLRSFAERTELPNEKYTIIKLKHGSSPIEIGKTLDQEEDIANVTPVFKVGSNRLVATDRILVGLNKKRKKNEIIDQLKGGILDEDELELVIKLDEGVDPFETIKLLDQMDQVEYAEPDFVNMSSNLPMVSQTIKISNLSSYSQFQYALQITKAREAWKHQTGNKEVKIAILDVGVDSSHEDLKEAIVGSYDGTDDDNFQEPNPSDGHGTACAGLAAAVRNGIGISGVGAGCSLLAVRIAFTNSRSQRIEKNSWIARAIDWAWQKGADVISNSWGGGLRSSKIINAFERARTKGRDGKGCVIVTAAGNDSSSVSFPGDLKNVLTVSATNHCDQPKTWRSCDGERWGSNFGPSVDVGAPGVNNYTTDIAGVGGFNDGTRGIDKNYVDNFSGTSSSAPLVAGCAGLILSANPNLCEAQVREIITSNTDKVGGVVYDSNGHNEKMGYGRLNVLKCVLAAKKRLSETP